MIKFFSKKKYISIVAVVLLLSVMSFTVADSVLAASSSAQAVCSTTLTIFNPLCWINLGLLTIIQVEGFAITMLTALFSFLLGLNEFTSAVPVQIGWTLVRDLANLFFVLIILAIAIGTILRIQSYNLAKALPKVIIMAVLVNFSLLIFGLIVDAAQILMATFVGSFADTFEKNLLVDALGIPTLVQSASALEQITTSIDVTISLIMAVVMLFIAFFVILVMLWILLLRTIMLWLLAILSPLPYLLSAFPQGDKYAKQWWSEFIKYVTVGPMLAFFLWLSLASLNANSVFDNTTVEENIKAIELSMGTDEAANTSGWFTKAGTFSHMLSYVISIALLLGGLVLTQKAGVAGGSFAGAVYDRARKTGVGTAKWLGRRGDDLQSKAFKGAFAKAGTTTLGKRMGLDIVGQEGLKVRTLPAVWKARSERVEKQRLGFSQEAATDAFNRIMPTSRSETDLRRRAFSASVETERKEQAATSTDAEEILQKLKTQDLDGNGRVKKGREASAKAKILQLTADHNINEAVLQSEDFLGDHFNDENRLAGLSDQEKEERKLDKTEDGDIQYTPHNVQEVVRHLFSNFDEDMQAEVAFDVGEVGFANKDSSLYKLARKNIKTGGYEMMSKDKYDVDKKTGEEKTTSRYIEQAEIAQKMGAKKAGRLNITNATQQNYLKETRVKGSDGERHGMATGMQEFGMHDLVNNPKALTAEFHMAANELRNVFRDNVDVMQAQAGKWREEGRGELADNLEDLAISAIAFGTGGRDAANKPSEYYGLSKNATKEEKREKYQEVIRKQADDNRIAKVDSLGGQVSDRATYAKIIESISGKPAPAALPATLPLIPPQAKAMTTSADKFAGIADELQSGGEILDADAVDGLRDSLEDLRKQLADIPESIELKNDISEKLDAFSEKFNRVDNAASEEDKDFNPVNWSKDLAAMVKLMRKMANEGSTNESIDDDK